MWGELEQKLSDQKAEIQTHGVKHELGELGKRIPSEKEKGLEKSFTEKQYDIGERIKEKAEIGKLEKPESMKEIRQEYLKDLKHYSEFPDTISKELFKESDLRKVSDRELQQGRKEFKTQKANLRREWETVNGVKWPTYEHDLKDRHGNIIRRAGDYYDAHHIQPLCVGGKNEVSNITPLSADVHYDRQVIHAFDSPCSRMIEKIWGEKK